MDKVLTEIKLPPYILNVKNHGQKNIDRQLGSLIGKTVCVSYTTVTNDNGEMSLGSRQHFEPQISVQATLEGNEETGKYRVLINDSTYCYFYNDSVWSMGQDVDKRPLIFFK